MKKTFSLLLCLIMAFGLLAGCNNAATTQTPAESPSTVSSTPESAESEAPAEPATLYPVANAGTKFDIWAPFHSQHIGVITDYNDVLAFQEMERRTNIHVNWIHPGVGTEAEQFNMIISSGDYPDMMNFFPTYYTSGLESAIKDNVVLQLNDIVEKYMPSYNERIDAVAQLQKDTKTDSGMVGAIYCIYTKYQDPWYGLLVRQDWLDDCGLDVPVTYDDWHEMLTAFKDKKGAEAPMLLYKTGDTPNGHMAGGYGVKNDFFVRDDGIVRYGPLEEGYKQYLTTMAQWYSEGLIDPDFNTRTFMFYMPDTNLSYSGKSGAFPVMGGFGTSPIEQGVCTDTNFFGTPVTNPVVNKGENTHFSCTSTHMGVGLSIMSTCSDAELAAKWLDYNYTDEGSFIQNFGVEGESFLYEADDQPVLSGDLLEKTFDQDYTKVRQMRGPIEFGYFRYMDTSGKYWVKDDQVDYDSENYKIQLYAAEIRTGKNDDKWSIPAFVSPTADEATEKATIMADIQTLVSEKTIAYILGAESLDTYDAFVAQLKEMDVERAVEIVQGYVDRYNKR